MDNRVELWHAANGVVCTLLRHDEAPRYEIQVTLNGVVIQGAAFDQDPEAAEFAIGQWRIFNETALELAQLEAALLRDAS